MNSLRALSSILFFLTMASATLAQDETAPGKCPPYDEPGKTFDANHIVDAIDTNGDGKMTHKEWVAAEAPDPSWNMFMDKEKVKAQGYITREDFVNETPPNGIDTDCDGFITIDEFLATKKWKMGPPPDGPSPGGAAKNRPTISSGERALAMLEVQNTFSKHAYYHAIGAHCEEMEDIWVREGGAYAKTATWTTFGSIYEGIPLLKEYYCTDNLKSKKRKLAEISKVYPEVKNIPENIGIGYGYTIHTQTTPIIEIAGDGKTAKGIWYSPGIGTNVEIRNDKPEISGGWFWEKYAVDFVKEDGKWKIWHFSNVMDPTPNSWGGQQGRMMQGPPPGEQEVMQIGGGRIMPTRPDPDPYESWSPTTLPRIYPRFPEPYYTFSETFSY